MSEILIPKIPEDVAEKHFTKLEMEIYEMLLGSSKGLGKSRGKEHDRKRVTQ